MKLDAVDTREGLAKSDIKISVRDKFEIVSTVHFANIVSFINEEYALQCNIYRYSANTPTYFGAIALSFKGLQPFSS
jgi:hypothetical protein